MPISLSNAAFIRERRLPDGGILRRWRLLEKIRYLIIVSKYLLVFLSQNLSRFQYFSRFNSVVNSLQNSNVDIGLLCCIIYETECPLFAFGKYEKSVDRFPTLVKIKHNRNRISRTST